MDEFFTLLFDPGLNEANHALGRACAELVDIAEEHDINAQLVCAEDA